jgi:hypothetical protein
MKVHVLTCDLGVVAVTASLDPERVEEILHGYFDRQEAEAATMLKGTCLFTWGGCEVDAEGWEIRSAGCTVHPDETDESVWQSGDFEPFEVRGLMECSTELGGHAWMVVQ